ncbi:MAG: FG-GAP-like repeat-containing protein [Chitinophagales bacterium]|nr:FG-GAP-like repeat-containing protein [Chitinophagales bacterium]
MSLVWFGQCHLYGQHLYFDKDQSIGSVFENFRIGAIEIGDINHDGHADLFFCGRTDRGAISALIYQNNGNNQFTQMPIGRAPLTGVFHGGGAFGDIDQDGYPELLVFGWSVVDGGQQTYFYKNNGGTGFTAMNHPFPGIIAGFAKFGDLDNDGDLDLILGGMTGAYDFVTGIYKNDGFGNFYHDDTYKLPQVGRCQGELVDLNGDGLLDLVIIGIDSEFNPIAKVFLNDSFGGLLEHTAAQLTGVYQGSIAIADVNGDEYPDLFLTGLTKYGGKSATLYYNDGNGSFTAATANNFDGVWVSSAQFSDVNKDGAADLVVVGFDDQYQSVLYFYLNNGLGVFREKAQSNIDGVLWGDIVFHDFDQDGDQDMIITGENYKYQGSTTYYTSMSESLPEPPTVNLGGDKTLCRSQNDTYELASGISASDVTFLWNTGATTSSITVTSSGTYEVVVINSYGQASHDAVTILFEPSPILERINVTEVDDFTFVFDAEGDNMDSYYWDFGDGTHSTMENPTHRYLEVGDYVVTLTVSNDCGHATLNYAVSIVSNTDNHSVSASASVKLYPNPTTNQVLIQSFSNLASYSIVGMDGQRIWGAKMEQTVHSHILDVSRLAVGQYIVEIVMTDGRVFKEPLSIVK